MKKIKKLLVFTLILGIFTPTLQMPVQAGIVKELVEVDADEREALEKERIRRQEEYKKEAQKQIVEKKKEAVPVQEPEPVKEVVEASPPKKHEHDGAFCWICKLFGSISGMTIGSISGLFRGSVAKSVDYTDGFPRVLGDGTVGHIIGVPTGAVTGLATGAGTGLLNGMFTGLSEGWKDPFSSKSYTFKNDFLDYDPYEFLGGGQ